MQRSLNIKISFVLLLMAGAAMSLVMRASGQGPVMGSAGVAGPGIWRPVGDVKYLGPQACVKCHEQESTHQHVTAMGRALEPAATSEVLKANPKLMFRSGPYSYEISRRGQTSIYSVSNGAATFAE